MHFVFSLLFLWLLLMANVSATLQDLGTIARNSPDFIVPITNSDLSLISQAERGHFTLILLTSTDEQHACESCHIIKNALRKVAYAWVSDYFLLDDLYIAEIDLVDRGNADVFNYLGLKTVPQLWLVPPSNIASKHVLNRQPKYDNHGFEYFDNYDILLEPHAEFKLPDQAFDDQVFAMADWLAKTVQKNITIRQENPYTKFIFTFVVTFSLILIVKKRGPSLVTQAVSKAKILKALFFVYLLVLLGGLLFSLMLQVPFVAQNDENELIYISGGSQWQFGAEIVLVGGVYGLLATTLIFLAYLGKYKITDSSIVGSETQRNVLVLTATALLYLFYSILTSLFLRKNEWYPYHFTKLF